MPGGERPVNATHLVLPFLVGALVGTPGIGAIVVLTRTLVRRDDAVRE
jgi:hypothetical protein